jgi:hypothetical protein
MLLADAVRAFAAFRFERLDEDRKLVIIVLLREYWAAGATVAVSPSFCNRLT